MVHTHHPGACRVCQRASWVCRYWNSNDHQAPEAQSWHTTECSWTWWWRLRGQLCRNRANRQDQRSSVQLCHHTWQRSCFLEPRRQRWHQIIRRRHLNTIKRDDKRSLSKALQRCHVKLWHRSYHRPLERRHQTRGKADEGVLQAILR